MDTLEYIRAWQLDVVRHDSVYLTCVLPSKNNDISSALKVCDAQSADLETNRKVERMAKLHECHKNRTSTDHGISEAGPGCRVVHNR